jgi:integrase
MPYKQNGRGTFVIQRQFKRIGRIKRSSGTDNLETFNSINGMITHLAKNGRWDVLEDLRDGRKRPVDIYTDYMARGRFEGLSNYKLGEPLHAAAAQWLAGLERSELTMRDYRNNFNQLFKRRTKFDTDRLRATAAVQELPALLNQYRAHCRREKTPRVFNYTRVTCLAFARDLFGANSEIYNRIREEKRLVEQKNRENNPQTPSQIRRLVANMPPAVADMVWTLCCTGARPKEYLTGQVTVVQNNDYIVIAGSKTASSAGRKVPLIRAVAPPARAYKAFRQYVSRASGGAVEPYDFRRSYAVWLSTAGVDPLHISMYMGHMPKSMTDLYRYHPPRHLKEDADRVQKWIEEDLVSSDRGGKTHG